RAAFPCFRAALPCRAVAVQRAPLLCKRARLAVACFERRKEDAMNRMLTRRYEMLLRVNAFGVSNAELFPQSNAAREQFAAIAGPIDALRDHAADQVSGHGHAKEGTTTRSVARRALRQELNAIAATAKALAVDTPGFDVKFKVPRGVGDHTVIAGARAFAQD